MFRYVTPFLVAIGLNSSAWPASFPIEGLAFFNGPEWGLRSSLLHQGTATSALAGQTLAWMALDTAWMGSSWADGRAFYREEDGRIEFKAQLYDGFSDPFALPVGSVVVSGDGFTLDRLDGVGRTNTVLGFLRFDFEVIDGDLADWLGGTTVSHTLSYVDKNYGLATQAGTPVNGKSASQLALLGARGDSVYVNAEGGRHWREREWTSFHFHLSHPTDGHQLGSNLVLELGEQLSDNPTHPVPEPSAFALMLVALLGFSIGAYSRKRR